MHQLGALQTKLGGASLVATNTVIKSSTVGLNVHSFLGNHPHYFYEGQSLFELQPGSFSWTLIGKRPWNSSPPSPGIVLHPSPLCPSLLNPFPNHATSMWIPISNPHFGRLNPSKSRISGPLLVSPKRILDQRLAKHDGAPCLCDVQSLHCHVDISVLSVIYIYIYIYLSIYISIYQIYVNKIACLSSVYLHLSTTSDNLLQAFLSSKLLAGCLQRSPQHGQCHRGTMAGPTKASLRKGGLVPMSPGAWNPGNGL